MEDSPKYGVSYLAMPPAATLDHEAFLTQAVAQTWAAGTHLLALPTIQHTPAFRNALADCPAQTDFCVQVWDLRTSSPAEILGTHCFSARGATAQACLAELATGLRKQEVACYDADPERFAEAQLEHYQALEAAA